MNKTENDESEIFVPVITENQDRKVIVGELPSLENLPIEEITVLPDVPLTGFYDCLVKRTLKEADTYTKEMFKYQAKMALPLADNPQFKHGHDDPNLRLNENETEGSILRRVWCSNGLLRELEENEIQDGQKITIKRKGMKLQTKWTVLQRN